MRTMVPWFLLCLPLSLFLPACQEEGDDDAADDDSAGDDDTAADPCAAAWDLNTGAILAEVDGQTAFAAPGGQYTLAGGLAINGVDQGISLTLSSMFDAEGQSVIDAIEGDLFPVDVVLGQNGAFTGYATVYDGPTTYISGSDHIGWLHLSGMDGPQLVGCFEFEAKETAGEAVQHWTGGLLRVPAM